MSEGSAVENVKKEVEALETQLEVEESTEKGMELLAVLRSLLPESMAPLLMEKLQSKPQCLTKTL